ncbi:unnamed protein product [Dicrocoelium dendriticum]|nr:unnamed protein product [Dicrocoelium dendriticum]
MAVLTPTETDCLLLELEPLVDTAAKKECLGVRQFTRLFTEDKQLAELFHSAGIKDINTVLRSDAVRDNGLKAIENFLKLISVASDAEKLAEYLEERAKSVASQNVTKEICLAAEPIIIDFYKGLVKSNESQAAIEKLLKHTYKILLSSME